MAEPLFVDRIHLLGPAGFHDAVKQAARDEGQTTSEFIRQAIRAKMKGAVPAPAEQAAGAGD